MQIHGLRASAWLLGISLTSDRRNALPIEIPSRRLKEASDAWVCFHFFFALSAAGSKQ